MVADIYEFTKNFPKEENYGLISQIRRAAVSVPSNIAEGSGRKSKREFVNFLYISMGSLKEVETQLIISQELGILNKEPSSRLSGCQRRFNIPNRKPPLREERFCCCRGRIRTFMEWLVNRFFPISPPPRQEGVSAGFTTLQCLCRIDITNIRTR